MITQSFNHFSSNRQWTESVLAADHIWLQVQKTLAEHNQTLPTTPRRPDVRLIVNNVAGTEIRFKNPAGHAGEKDEVIPATGDRRAVMIIPAGDTLEDQQRNAHIVFDKYDLGKTGLNQNFVTDLKQGLLSGYIKEAYGPAPFEEQASKLVNLTWNNGDSTSNIKPHHAGTAAFGARAATSERVFLALFDITVKGTQTSAEKIEQAGIAIAIDSDWVTGAETTRPIVPSVARGYYGAHFDKIPQVSVHPMGIVTGVSLPQTKPPAAKPEHNL